MFARLRCGIYSLYIYIPGFCNCGAHCINNALYKLCVVFAVVVFQLCECHSSWYGERREEWREYKSKEHTWKCISAHMHMDVIQVSINLNICCHVGLTQHCSIAVGGDYIYIYCTLLCRHCVEFHAELICLCCARCLFYS